MKLKIIFLVILLMAFLFVVVSYIHRSTLERKIISNTDSSIKKESQIPFYEMTIPGLRNRVFQSSLNEKTKYQSKVNYESYLTSYLSDGLKINALLTIPKGEKPQGGWPAVVFVHGYIPPSIYRTTERYIEYVDYLAMSGFVVLKIDLRGHGSSDGDPSGAYYSASYVIDTLNAYSALENSDFVDPKAIGLWGHSMAGNVTFRSFVVKKNIPALVIWAGAVYSYDDLLTYRLNDQSYRPPADRSRVNEEREKLRLEHGEYMKGSSFWEQVVPTNYLDGVSGAIQLHHAADDTVVNIGYSRDLVKTLDKSRIKHTFFEYPTGGHNISGTNFVVAMKRTVEFLKTELEK